MKIYVDVVLLINALMNIVIFFISSIFLNKKTKKFRIVLAGFVTGLIYCLFMFIPILHNFYNFFTSLFMVSIGIFIAFYPFSKKEFLKTIFVVHIVTFAIGGIGMALFYTTNIGEYVGDMISFSFKNFSVKLLLSSVCISYIFVKIINDYLKNNKLRKEDYADVTVVCNNKEVTGRVLIDTGNSLKDALTDTHVVILEFELIKELLPDELKLLYYENMENNLELLMEKIKDTWVEKNIRFIPFKAIGNENGILIGFLPEKIKINWQNKSIEIDKIIIGISNFIINKDKKFQGILNPEILENIVDT